MIMRLIQAFGLRALGAVLTFSFNVLLARMLGVEGAGIFFLSLAFVTVVSIISRLGLDHAMMRFIASFDIKNDKERINNVYVQGMKWVILASIPLTLLCIMIAPWLANTLFHKAELASPMRWMCLSILPFSLLNIQAECFKGIRQINWGVFFQSVGLPLFSLLMIMPLVSIAGVIGVVWAYSIAAFIQAIAAIVFWWKISKTKIIAPPSFTAAKLWLSCRSLWLVSIINGALLPWMPLLIAGLWLSSEELGVFAAAERVSLLLGFFLVAASNVFAPEFSRLYQLNKMHEFKLIVRRSVLIPLVLSLPVFVLLAFNANIVMLLYGEAFVSGGGILLLLMLGQFVNVISGPVGYILIMTGHEHLVRRGTIIACVVQLIMCGTFIPMFGMVGAAIAVATGVALNNIIAVYYVRNRLGMAYPLSFGS